MYACDSFAMLCCIILIVVLCVNVVVCSVHTETEYCVASCVDCMLSFALSAAL